MNEAFYLNFVYFLNKYQDSNQERSRRRSSGSSDRGLTSPPPISLGKRVEVDLKEKQKKFEGLDKNAEEVTTGINFQTEYVREKISVSCSELINRFNLVA